MRSDPNPSPNRDSPWDAVFTELENQLGFGILGETSLEKRNRTTMQCQRLLPDRYVAMGAPVTAVRKRGTDHPRGPFVVAFTDDGPWLFKASGSNPGLPRKPIGPIEDPSPISISPHDRDSGLLQIGELTFVVPYLHTAGVRAIVTELASPDGSDPHDPDSDGEGGPVS